MTYLVVWVGGYSDDAGPTEAGKVVILELLGHGPWNEVAGRTLSPGESLKGFQAWSVKHNFILQFAIQWTDLHDALLGDLSLQADLDDAEDLRQHRRVRVRRAWQTPQSFTFESGGLFLFKFLK